MSCEHCTALFTKEIPETFSVKYNLNCEKSIVKNKLCFADVCKKTATPPLATTGSQRIL